MIAAKKLDYDRAIRYIGKIMKIRFMSDLHLEFSPMKFEYAGEDILILAGDIALHTDAMAQLNAVAAAWDIPVLILAGNHEFYTNSGHQDHTWEDTIDDLRRAADHNVKIVKGDTTFFEDTVATYEGVRFIGATLWTDMNLFGDAPIASRQVQLALSDYVLIRKDKGMAAITADDTMARHAVSRKFIADTLAQPFDGQTVVFTHHAPSWKSVEFKDDKISAGYASRLEELMLDHEPVLWIHGHTHKVFDYKVGETRVMCNPRGYVPDGLVEGFDPKLVVEI